MDNRRAGLWLLFLGGAVVVALIPQFFPPPEEPALAPAGPVAGPGASGPVTRPAAGDGRGPGTAPAAGMAGAGLFAAHSWTVAPPPSPAPVWTPPAPVAPPPATAPPLPFEFVGKLDDAQRLRVFLTWGEKIYTVTVGDVIDGTYRVERIKGDEMVLTYLPLNVTQTLSVGDRL